jgi:SH3-like domain-containing protein
MSRLAAWLRTGLLATLLVAQTALAAAQTPSPPREVPPPPAGANLPRFVSLRSDEVNLRTGPGVRYPVEWVLQRRYMPVEVLAEFENWRKIRDWQGTEGWVHQSMLSGRRYAIVTGDVRVIRRQPEPNSPAVARLEPGVVAQIVECKDQWCRVDANGLKGWLTRGDFWGVYGNENVK